MNFTYDLSRYILFINTNEVIAREISIMLVACFTERKNTGSKIRPVLNIIFSILNKGK